MKIELNVSELQETIKKAEKLIPKKSTLKILQSIKLSALQNSITITVNSLDTMSIFKLNAGSIQEEGEMLIPSDTLKLIQKLKNENYITISDNLIQAGSKTLKFNSLDIDFFPKNFDDCTIQAFSISQSELCKAFNVNYTCSAEENRPIFTGVCIDNYTFVGTDTHRMSWHRADIDNKLEKQVVIPCQLTKILQSNLLDKKSNKPVNVSVNEKYSYLKLEFENTLIITRLIEGTFPNYKQIIPQNYDTRIKLNVKKVLDELSFIEDMTKGKKDNSITLAIDENAIYFDAMDEGNAVTLEINSDITGKPIECMGINYKFLVEALKNAELEGDYTEIKFAGQYSPLLFNNSLVLPVRVNNM